MKNQHVRGRHFSLTLLAGMAVLSLAGAAHPAAAAADEVRCGTDETGSISAWLVSTPVIGPENQLETDLLQDFGGEAKLRPQGLVTSGNGKQLDWRPFFSDRPILNLAPRPLNDKAFYYLYTTVEPENGGTLTLSCHYWSDVVIWIDGEKVVTGRRERATMMSMASAQVRLDKGRRHAILVKLANGFGEALFNARFLDGDIPVPVTSVLSIPGSQQDLARYLPDSLEVRLEDYRFLEPDRTARVLVGKSLTRAIPAGLTSTLTATAEVATRDGKKLDSYKLGKFSPQDLEAKPLSFSFRPGKGDATPFYAVTINLQLDGKPAGQAVQRFYSIPGIKDEFDAVVKRAERFWKERKEDELYEDKDLAYLLLKVEQLKLLYDTELNSPDFGDRAMEIIAEGQGRISIMERRVRIRPAPGINEFAYISRVDDSAQPYSIYMPRSYDRMKGAPLIVYLHGYDPDLNKLNWQILPENLTQLCEQYGYLLVAPFGRSNTDFQGIGEQDVMHVLDLTLREFNVDRDRVFLVGYSMGGMGAYTIAGHCPDRWAGVIGLAGRADYYMWREVKPADLPPFKQWLVGLEFGAEYPENFRNLPVLAFQGEFDSLIEKEQSSQFVATLEGLGYNARFESVPGESHRISTAVFSKDTVFEWMGKLRRPEAPDKITFTLYSLKYNKAYWLTVDDLKTWGQRAQVDLEVTGPNEIAVKETNVAAFTLDPPAKLFDLSKPIVVRVGGKEFKFDAPVNKPLSVAVEPPRQSPLRKTSSLCGPIKDAFNSRFLIVYGTQGDPVKNKDVYVMAEQTVKDWRGFVKSVQLLGGEKDLLLVRDRDLTQEQEQAANLILIGTPKTNSVLARIAGKLPVKFGDDGSFIVGQRKFAGDKVGLNMIYPNPSNPARYIVVKAGAYYGQMLSDNHKLDMLPDFIVYDDASDRDGLGMWDGAPNRALCAGFFDKYWGLSDQTTWAQGARADGFDVRRR